MLPRFIWTWLILLVGMTATLQLNQANLQPPGRIALMAAFWGAVAAVLCRVVVLC